MFDYILFLFDILIVDLKLLKCTYKFNNYIKICSPNMFINNFYLYRKNM